MRVLKKDEAPAGARGDSATIRRAPRLADFISDRLDTLCHAAGLSAEAESAVQTFRSLVSPWGDTPLNHSTGWVSEISDDNTPVEFSVAMAGGKAEVRVLFEAQGEEPTLASFRRAGLALNQRLEREFGAHLERFYKLEDLFLPEVMRGPFAVWHSAVFAAGRKPAFKVYFNPQAAGVDQAEHLVSEALARLGIGQAWPKLRSAILRRGPFLDELKYFSLDLTSSPEARAKVYVRHHGANADDMERAASASKSYLPGEAAEFVRAMRGGDTPLQVRAPFSCSAFVGASEAVPVSTTVYVPACAYARDDAAIQRRVHDYLAKNGYDSSAYDALITGYANRPLNEGVGMQSWIAFRRVGNQARITTYLSTEARLVHAPGVVPAPTSDRLGAVARR